MTNDIKISRELAERWLDPSQGSVYERYQIVSEELRALLAAPVVERQEPVAEVVMVDPFVLTTGNLHLLRKGAKLYTSPPAPVTVVLPASRYIFDKDYDDEDRSYSMGWNACLNKVKELNQ